MSNELDLSEFDGDLAGIQIDPSELDDDLPENTVVCAITGKYYEINVDLFEELRDHDDEETGITFLPVSTEVVEKLLKALKDLV